MIVNAFFGVILVVNYKTYTKEQIEEVKRLFEDGKNKCEISRITGVPRGTIKSWIIPRYEKKTDKPRNSYVPIINFDEYLDTTEKRAAYSYALAVYLCDGCISMPKSHKVPSLRCVNDNKYPINTQEWMNNLKILFPENSVNCLKHHKYNCSTVVVYSKKLIDLFPQHGKGKKNQREIKLEQWQSAIVNEHPNEFIKGCIQADGCIYKDKKTQSKRYSFTNTSIGIMDIFLETLRLIGINKKPSFYPKTKIYNVSIGKKSDIAILEPIISNKE